MVPEVQRSESHRGAQVTGLVAMCINCGCTDLEACADGCSWLAVDRKQRRGVCSKCPGDVARFTAGRLNLSTRAMDVEIARLKRIPTRSE